MPDILVKNLPLVLHRRLKDEAKFHHRSMNQEIQQILASHLGRSGVPEIKPFMLTKPLNDAFIKNARNEGRA